MHKYLKIVIFFSLFITSLWGETLHVIIVGDSLSELRSQVVKDTALVKSQSQKLASLLNIPVSIHELLEEEVTRSKILETIHSEKIDKADLIIFYFSGHGFRTKGKPSKWPYIYFTHHNHCMELDEVIQELQKKESKYAIVIADCCNHLCQGGHCPPKMSNYFKTHCEKTIDRSTASLFRNSEGILVMSGSEPGGLSWATEEGGILTCALFDALSEASSALNWEEIMTSVRKHTEDIQRIQYAFYHQDTRGGKEHKMASGLPPEEKPNFVPRS